MHVETCTGLDLATHSVPLLLHRDNQSAQPTPATGELLVWRDSDDGKVYLVYTDATSGGKKVELT